MEDLNKILIQLKEDKVIDSLVEYAYILKMVREIWLNDEIIKSIGTLLDSLLSLVPVIERISNVLNDPNFRKVIDVLTSEDVVKIIQNPEKMTFTKLLKEMGDEKFQKGLGIIVKLIEKIGEATSNK